ncbi:MAG: ABC transporter permease [Roseiflexus sp.]|jgi:ABC-type transport system involved in multi-copper enzyme maturation permease subunit|nr:ABC transporter permease [Roseiflexus sp.]MBO9335983.1 ABC transporter permease [Roseiflexus sp.]MBO9366831.1 ABC transporter permease [Roseiflexus sp.]MBO9381574.1 ABC transporter permease [Roseiflexus sp.]MBO9387636.1 ABC transporter permease [Roseiflexus sp.]
MINLIRAEWLKLSRRPLSWILLILFLVLLVAQILTQFALTIIIPVQSGVVNAQIEEWRRGVIFPGIFATALSHVNSLGGIFAVIFVAGAIGSEYSWGTLRTQLARDPARDRYLLAKLTTIMLMLTVATLLAMLLASLLSVILSPILGSAISITSSDLINLIPATLRALYVLLPYVLLTAYAALLTRSVLGGVAIGLSYIIVETGFGALALLRVLGGVWALVYNLTIGQNINTLTLMNRHAFGLRPETTAPLDLTQLPSPLQATIVVAVYSALFLVFALILFRRRDISGPG